MNRQQYQAAAESWMKEQQRGESVNQLVFIENGRAVTDSLMVAEGFEKEHARVMRDIRELACSEEFRVGNFAESTYINSQGREMPKYLITEKGFSMLAMGYTGPKAMEFKEKYISEFDRMRQQLQAGVPTLSPNQAMAIALQQTAEMMTKVPVLENRLESVERKVDEQITLHSGEQTRLKKAILTRICQFEQDKEARKPLFRILYKELYDRYEVPSYKDILRKDLQEALQFVGVWRPKRSELDRLAN